MVIRWNQKNLILLTIAFSLQFVKSYADPNSDQEKYKKHMQNELENLKKNDHWVGLNKTNKDELIKNVFFGDKGTTLPAEVLKKQIDLQGEKREGFLNEVLTENSTKQNPDKLSAEVLKKQIDLQGKKREGFLNEVLTENSTKANPDKLSAEVLKKQIDLQGDNREGFLNEVLTENSAKKNPDKLSAEVLKKQIDLQGDKRKEFLDGVVKENSTRQNPVKLSAEVLKKQIDLQGDERESFLNEVLTENSEKNPIKLSTEVLVDQYKKRDNPDEFLKERLDAKTPTERQELINSLLKTYTNKELLQNLSGDGCKKVGENANPTYVGATHVIDWLNTAHFKGFFQPTMTYALVNGDTFNDFDTFNQWNLWIEPFGFYTPFRREAEPLKFNMYTAGISVGGEYTFFDRLVFGLGLAYSHSGVTWLEHRIPSEQKEQENANTPGVKKQKFHTAANLNSIYFGPSLSYVFSHGYLSCTIFGVANFYQVNRETNLFPTKIEKPNKSTPEYNSWDIVGRLEGGLSYEVGGDFFLYPTAKVDYLKVFKQDSIENLDDDTELSIEAFDGSFLNSKIGLKATREFFYETMGYLIPSLSAGFINFTPLSNKSYQYKIGECDKFEERLKIGSWNQSYLGAGFAIVHKRGVLISLDYELTVGADSPLHAGNLRVEWSW